jgi:hypothetical protein
LREADVRAAAVANDDVIVDADVQQPVRLHKL